MQEAISNDTLLNLINSMNNQYEDALLEFIFAL